jgi:tetratricopeptide (TPR) repeat protein
MAEDAVQQFQMAIQLDGSNYRAHFELGEILGRKGLLDDAIAEMSRAVTLNSDFAQAHCSMGRLLKKKKELNG